MLIFMIILKILGSLGLFFSFIFSINIFLHKFAIEDGVFMESVKITGFILVILLGGSLMLLGITWIWM